MRCGKCVKFPSCSDDGSKNCGSQTFWPACSALVKNLNFHFLQQIGGPPKKKFNSKLLRKRKVGKQTRTFAGKATLYFFFFGFSYHRSMLNGSVSLCQDAIVFVVGPQSFKCELHSAFVAFAVLLFCRMEGSPERGKEAGKVN